MDKIRTAVVGAGKMGTIHAKVYNQLPQSDFVAVVDIDLGKAQSLANQYNCSAYSDCADSLSKVDAVTIATPTVTHLNLAKIFIKKKISVPGEGATSPTSNRHARLSISHRCRGVGV